MPVTASIDIAIRADHKLDQAILHPAPATPLAPFGDTQKQALKALADIILKCTATSASYPAPLAPTGALLLIFIPPRTATTSPPRVLAPPVPPRMTQLPSRVAIVPSLLRRAPVHIIPPDEHQDTPPCIAPNRYPTGLSQHSHVAIEDDVLYPTIHRMNHIMNPDTGNICGYTQLSNGKVPGQDAPTLVRSLSNEFGRLAKGVG